MVAKPTLKRMGIALFAWLAVLIVLMGAVRAGRPFVYCHAMEAIRSRCCCSHADENVAATLPGPASPEASLTASVEMSCCCERGTLPSLLSAASAQLADQPSAPWVATIPPADPQRDVLLASVTCAPPRAYRSTSPPRSAAASCARLSVFLI